MPTHTTLTKYGRVTTLTPMTQEQIEAQCKLVTAACDDDPGEEGEEAYEREQAQKAKKP